MKTVLIIFITTIFLISANSSFSLEKELEGLKLIKKEIKKISVKRNSKVKIQYTGTLSDGSIFDKTNEGEPLEFVVGQGQVLPKFEDEILEMKVNEEKKFKVKTEEAFGKRNETLIQNLPKFNQPGTPTIEKGSIITIFDKSGKSIPGLVLEVSKETITVDLNHPLAGKDLTFKVKVVDIE